MTFNVDKLLLERFTKNVPPKPTMFQINSCKSFHLFSAADQTAKNRTHNRKSSKSGKKKNVQKLSFTGKLRKKRFWEDMANQLCSIENHTFAVFSTEVGLGAFGVHFWVLILVLSSHQKKKFEEAIKVDENENRVVGALGMLRILFSERSKAMLTTWPGTCLDRVLCAPKKRKCRLIGWFVKRERISLRFSPSQSSFLHFAFRQLRFGRQTREWLVWR